MKPGRVPSLLHVVQQQVAGRTAVLQRACQPGNIEASGHSLAGHPTEPLTQVNPLPG